MSRAVPTIVKAATNHGDKPLSIAIFGCKGFESKIDKKHSVHRFSTSSVDADLEIDAVICSNNPADLNRAYQFAKQFQAPVVCVWQKPPAGVHSSCLKNYHSFRGDVDLFESKQLADSWGIVDGEVSSDPNPVIQKACVR